MAAILAVFAVLFIALQISSYTRSSATWDEPIHLTAGYAAAAGRDYRVDPSHPPLVRMWAALPLLFMDDVRLDATPIDRAAPEGWLQQAYAFAHGFLYREHDADRLLYAGRFMVMLLGVLLGGLLFSWTREWLGLLPAAAVLVLYMFEPNLFAHAHLVTTDFGITVFMFGAVYFLWRFFRRQDAPDLVGVAACTAAAVLTKFSAILLLPILVVLVVLAVRWSALPRAAALRLAGITSLVTFAAIWVAYGFRFSPGPSAAWQLRMQDTALGEASPALSGAISAVEGLHLLPAAFTQGLLYGIASSQQFGMYLAGQYSTDGWWYYFPLAFLVKTPLALIALVAIGLGVLIARRRETGGLTVACLVLPAGLYLAWAMTSGINVGLRHILPIYPFLLLLAAGAVHALLGDWPGRGADTRGGGRLAGRLAVATLLVALAAEFATAYPHPLTFFNQAAGGPANGYRMLADSNLGWGQGLKPLKDWMDREGVEHVNLAYFGQADPAYYGIDATHLPGAPSFALDEVARPTLPGYVAISGTTMAGVYLRPRWRLFYSGFRTLEPMAVVGNSIRVYWVEQWPEAEPDTAPVDDVGVHLRLADTLLFGQQWASLALHHYREYLAARPDDPGALVNSGIALVTDGRIEEGIDAFRRAVEVAPDDGYARLTLARALFGDGDVAGAALHGSRALALRPGDPAAHDLMGRVRAVQGDFAGAERHLRRALEIDPTHADARRHLQTLLNARGF